MKLGERLVLAAASAVVVAGSAGAFTVHGSRSPAHPVSTPTTAPSTTTVPTTSETTTPDAPGPSSPALAAGMLAPVDLGGFYRVNAPYASTVLSSAPCLAGMAPSPSQNGRAFTGLIVPGGHPAIAEVAASYPGSGAEQVYHAVSSALGACTAFSVNLAGSSVRVQMSPRSAPSVGDASQAYGGTFTVSGMPESLQVEVVLDSNIVLVVVYADTVPASNAIYGDLPSTVGAAIGKLA
jgi:hypothetical protein